MGIFSTIFGGSSTKVKQYSTQNKEQQALMGQVLPELTAPAPTYPGKVSTSQSNAERYSLKALENLALGFADGQSELYKGANQTLLDILSAGATDFQDYYNTNMYDPAVKQFNEEILPTTRNEFVDQYFSGERRAAENKATDTLEKNLLQSRSKLAFDTREADRNAKLQALGLVDKVGGAEADDINSVLQGVGTGDTLEQGRLDKDYQKFLDETSAKDDRLKNILDYLGIQTTENIAKTKSSKGILGGLADATKAYASVKGA